MRWASGIAWILAVAVAGSAAAQSLGEAAAKEKKRREAQKAAQGKTDKTKAKTFSDEDLPKSDPAVEGGAGEAPDESQGPVTGDEGKRVRAAEIKKSLEECRANLASAREALKAAEAAPVLVPQPGDDPFNEEPVAEEPPTDAPPPGTPPPPRPTKDQKVQEAKALVAQTEKQCADIEDSVRKEGIPPGWIR